MRVCESCVRLFPLDAELGQRWTCPRCGQEYVAVAYDGVNNQAGFLVWEPVEEEE